MLELFVEIEIISGFGCCLQPKHIMKKIINKDLRFNVLIFNYGKIKSNLIFFWDTNALFFPIFVIKYT